MKGNSSVSYVTYILNQGPSKIYQHSTICVFSCRELTFELFRGLYLVLEKPDPNSMNYEAVLDLARENISKLHVHFGASTWKKGRRRKDIFIEKLLKYEFHSASNQVLKNKTKLQLLRHNGICHSVTCYRHQYTFF